MVELVDSVDLGAVTSVKVLGGIAMNWGELSVFRKVVFIIWILCLITGIALTILDVEEILASIEILEDVIDCVFWLSAGIVSWKKESLFPIVCFILSGLNLICVFI